MKKNYYKNPGVRFRAVELHDHGEHLFNKKFYLILTNTIYCNILVYTLCTPCVNVTNNNILDHCDEINLNKLRFQAYSSNTPNRLQYNFEEIIYILCSLITRTADDKIINQTFRPKDPLNYKSNDSIYELFSCRRDNFK